MFVGILPAPEKLLKLGRCNRQMWAFQKIVSIVDNTVILAFENAELLTLLIVCVL